MPSRLRVRKAVNSRLRCKKLRSIQFVPFDLAEIEGIADLVKTLRKDFGPIYGLVNNAGISAEGALALMPNSQIEQVVRLNTLSPMVMTKYVVRSMMADGGGRIVNVASITGIHRLQRTLSLQRHQSLAHCLYPIAGKRSGTHGSERKCRRSRLCRYGHDSDAQRRAP